MDQVPGREGFRADAIAKPHGNSSRSALQPAGCGDSVGKGGLSQEDNQFLDDLERPVFCSLGTGQPELA